MNFLCYRLPLTQRSKAPEFEGAHCEILIGTQSVPSTSSKMNMASTATWIRPFFLSFFLTLTIISIGLFLQWKYIGIHVTPNHGEQPDEGSTTKGDIKEDPAMEQAPNFQNNSNKKSSNKEMDFDEMIEIEEDTEGHFV
jgi:hypothetical protein